MKEKKIWRTEKILDKVEKVTAAAAATTVLLMIF